MASHMQNDYPDTEVFRDTGEILETAQLHHRAGRLQQAEAMYRQVLTRDPQNADAFHLLGLLALQISQNDVAQDLILTAIHLAPNNALYYCNLATAFYAEGALEQAEECYRKAVALDPDYGEAWLNLGIVLKVQERFQEAAEVLDTAVVKRPTDATAFAQLAEVMIRLAQYETAENLARAATNLAPEDPKALSALADTLNLLGRPQEAGHCGEKLIELDPGNPQHYLVLAEAKNAAGMRKDQEKIIRQALRLDPDNSQAYGMLSACYMNQTRWDEALETIDRAIELKPEGEDLVAYKAHILERQGRYQEALDLVKPLLDGRTNFQGGALDVFATLARRLNFRNKAIEVMEDVFNHRNIPQSMRCTLLFSLGQLYDDLGLYKKAFRSYRQANELKPHEYAKDKAKDLLQRIAEQYTSTFFDHAPRATHGAKRPIFIVGMPRSGTSLTEQIIASHPRVFGAGELQEISAIARDLPGMIGTDNEYPECMNEANQAIIDNAAQRYLRFIDELAPQEAAFVTDKLPMNAVHMGLIALLFPDSKIIFCHRNPLDTCLSCYFQNFGARGLAYTYNLQHLGEFYRHHEEATATVKEALPLPVLDLHYETLVTDPDTQVQRLLDFLELEWDEACLRPWESQRQTKTASYAQVRNPFYQKSVGRWKHYKKHLGPLIQALGDKADLS